MRQAKTRQQYSIMRPCDARCSLLVKMISHVFHIFHADAHSSTVAFGNCTDSPPAELGSLRDCDARNPNAKLTSVSLTDVIRFATQWMAGEARFCMLRFGFMIFSYFFACAVRSLLGTAHWYSVQCDTTLFWSVSWARCRALYGFCCTGRALRRCDGKLWKMANDTNRKGKMSNCRSIKTVLSGTNERWRWQKRNARFN